MEARSRVHGELLSVGLEVTLIDRPRQRDSGAAGVRAWLAEVAADGQIDAVIDISDDTLAADVWVIEKAPPRIELSRIVLPAETRNSSEMLAIRAVEVLRSTFLERDMVTRQQRREFVATPSNAPIPPFKPFPRHEQQQQSDAQERFGIELGAAALTSLEGLGPALLPIARVDWRARPAIIIQAMFAGPGSRPRVANSEGSASIAQQYGTVGVGFRFRPHRRVWPYLVFSAGVLRTSVAGRAESPWQSHTVARWSFLTEGGAGVGLRVSDSCELSLAAHLQLATPYVAIHIADSVVATAGRPGVAVSLTVGAWL